MGRNSKNRGTKPDDSMGLFLPLLDTFPLKPNVFNILSKSREVKMPNWVILKRGILCCALCSYAVCRVGDTWICSNGFCEKHNDLPIEQQRGTIRVINPNYTMTASGTSLSSVNPYRVSGTSWTTTT